MARLTRPRPTAFTLLELLLALTILASLAGLSAAAFTQTRYWGEADAANQRVLRLQRVLSAMQRQWSDRRAAVRGESLGADASASTAPSGVRFVTSSPILFPDWPLVIASYAIVDDERRTTPAGAPARRLVYAETRLTGPDGAPDETALDRRGRPFTESIVLLDGLPELRFERFGRGADADAPGADEDELVERWRPYENEFEGDVPAVRLVGVHEGERFGCVLVVQALR